MSTVHEKAVLSGLVQSLQYDVIAGGGRANVE